MPEGHASGAGRASAGRRRPRRQGRKRQRQQQQGRQQQQQRQGRQQQQQRQGRQRQQQRQGRQQQQQRQGRRQQQQRRQQRQRRQRKDQRQPPPRGRASGRVARDHGHGRLGPLHLYRCLLATYGELDWWPAEGPFEVMVGAVLTQRTAWANVERALQALRAAGVDGPAALLSLPPGRLEGLVRPSGTYRQKAARLRALFGEVESGGGQDAFLALPPAELRRRLLAVRGIGPETADSIVLYAAGGPVFVVDAYTRRLLGRLGIGEGAEGYDRVAEWFVRGLPMDVGTYRNAHAVIVEHCKRHCRAAPICGGCPLGGECPSFVKG